MSKCFFSSLGNNSHLLPVRRTPSYRRVNIAFVFCGVAGAICLIPATVKFFKGEPQSKDAITSVGLGLVAVFIILAIIKAVMAFN